MQALNYVTLVKIILLTSNMFIERGGSTNMQRHK